jgi:hypothetical protein
VQISSSKLSFSGCLNRLAQPDFRPRAVEVGVAGMSFPEALKTAAPETDCVVLSDRVNPASDALLLNLIDKLPSGLASMTWAAIKRWVTRGDGTPEPLKSRQHGDFQVGKQAPLRLDSLSRTLQATMAEFPDLQPTIGAEHVWSNDARGFQGPGFWRRVGGWMCGERPFPFPTFARSKLICALGLGATSVVMPTGREKDLRTWMLAQKPASIEVHHLFREAYRLHEGDLYGTLLCAENVLSEGLYDPQRQDREVTSRLSYLRNDSAPEGDNFGAWYHMFGAALYSLMRPEWKANLCMKVEGAGSLILEGKDAQEDHLNQIGTRLGVELKRIVRDGVDGSRGVQPYVELAEFPWNRSTVRGS